MQQQREAVRVQRLELRVHGARVASASPVLRHVMRVQCEGLEQSVGLHGHEAIRGLSTALPKPIEGARHGKHRREQREPPEHVETNLRGAGRPTVEEELFVHEGE